MGNDVLLYDSIFTSPSIETKKSIAQLIQSKEKHFDIMIMNVQRQTNSVDCGLYATAMLASLLLDQDPTTIVYNKEELHLHLTNVLEEKKISLQRPENMLHKLLAVRSILCIVFVDCQTPVST